MTGRVPQPLNCFEFVHPVFRTMWDQLSQSNRSIDAIAIDSRLQELAKSYDGQKSGTSPRYDDPLTRLAYMYGYMPSHAFYVYLVLREARILDRLRTRYPRVVSIGGGPGSDLLGLLKLNSESDRPLAFDVSIFDRVPDWKQSWQAIEGCYGHTLPLRTRYRQLDLTRCEQWRAILPFADADLYLFTYVAAEICAFEIHSRRSVLEPFLAWLFTRAAAGCMFVFIDNRYDPYLRYLDSTISRAAGETELHKIPGPNRRSIVVEDVRGAVHTSPVIDTSEWNYVLSGPYRAGLQRWPRRDAKLMARVCTRT